MEDFEGVVKVARYSAFAIGSEKEDYALNVLGQYSGTAGRHFSVLIKLVFAYLWFIFMWKYQETRWTIMQDINSLRTMWTMTCGLKETVLKLIPADGGIIHVICRKFIAIFAIVPNKKLIFFAEIWMENTCKVIRVERPDIKEFIGTISMDRTILWRVLKWWSVQFNCANICFLFDWE